MHFSIYFFGAGYQVLHKVRKNHKNGVLPVREAQSMVWKTLEKRKPAKCPQLVFMGTTLRTGSYWTGAEGLEPPTNGFGDRYSTIELRPYMQELLRFFVQHVFTH